MNKQFLSVGIVPYFIEDDDEDSLISSNLRKNHIYFLMIQRKDTIGFTEFIRGKYEVSNIPQIQCLIDMMTVSEKEGLLTKTFHDLWHSMWYEKYYTNQAEYLKAKHKYDIISGNNTLQSCIQNSKTAYIEPEWGFPKGRKNRLETNIECAIREMKEETNIDHKDYSIIKNVKTKEEIYESVNSKYIHKYFLCKLNRSSLNSIFSCILTVSQKKEVKNIGLFHYEECLNLIRDYDVQKKKLITDYYKLVSTSTQFKILSQFYTKTNGEFDNRFFNKNITLP
jgi:8-oxo-dGTP pyrophosphatase MutT (NUDIX family)